MNKNTGITASLLLIAAIVTSCATKPEDIEPSYISPLAYEAYSCEQLGQEAARVSQNASSAIGTQENKAKKDATAVGIGVILFWPALLFVKGSSANEAEVARLKGEMETIEKVSIQKQCGFQFQKS